MKVLAVDDDRLSRLILANTLQSLGYEVEEASCCEDAWNLLNAVAARVVVADWRMPGEDGLELCRRIRARGGEYVYFILLTNAEPSEANQELASRAGVDDYLSKPVNPRELRNRLHVAERILRFTVELRQLESFLPICGYCKKVRNDSNYWEQIEDYIAKHADAPLSYGICPDCYQSKVIPKLEDASVAEKADLPLEPTRSGPRPTLAMIARKLGVSSAAVSMALRNHPRISAEMRERVNAAARELGYTPDPEVRKVMRSIRVNRKPGFKSVLYGLLTNDAPGPMLDMAELIRGCEMCAVQNGYGFTLLRLSERDGEGRLQRMLVSRGVEGVVFLSGGVQMGEFREQVDWKRFSVMALANGHAVADIDAVRPHWYYSVERAYHELTARGVRRIGAVFNRGFDYSLGHSLMGAVRAFADTGLSAPLEPFLSNATLHDSSRGSLTPAPFPPPHTPPPAATPAAEWDRLAEWFAQQKPEALVFDHETSADEALAHLAARKITPQHVAVLNRGLHSRHAGVVQKTLELGYAAIDLLTRKIERGLRGPQSSVTVTKIKGHWSEANTDEANRRPTESSSLEEL